MILSTYQAGKLIVVSSEGGSLRLSFHSLDQAMGIAVAEGRLAFGGKRQIHVATRNDQVAEQIQPAATYDSCWLTRRSLHTGQIDAHELAWAGDELWV
ncbi:MAG: DUF4915 domain-containing protein, partial [Planctomycetota bacterium]